MLLAGVVATAGWQQKRQADNHNAWWKKFEWVVDNLDADGNHQREIVWLVLPALLDDKHATGRLAPFADTLRDYLEELERQEDNVEALQPPLPPTRLNTTEVQREGADHED